MEKSEKIKTLFFDEIDNAIIIKKFACSFFKKILYILIS